MTKSKPYCLAPWTSVQYSGVYEGGGISVCCEWRGKKFKGDICDYQSSDYLKDIKRAMVEHDMEVLAPACNECILSERTIGHSTRKHIQKNSEHYNILDKIWRIDYRPDNLCNLKCRMCSPNSSSLIEEEYVKHQYVLTEFLDKRETHDVIEFDMQHLKEFCILGGEPTFNKKLYSIMDHVSQVPDVRLSYTTNATSFSKKWEEMINKFSDIHVNLSIDATHDTYEYIRTNAQWKVVEKNIPKFINNTSSFSVNPVLMVYNVVTIDRWIEYFLQFDPQNVNFSPVYGDIPLSLSLIPEDLRAEKIQYLTALNHPVADKAIKIISSFTFDSTKIDHFIHKTEFQDSIRNTDIFALSEDFKRIWAYGKYNKR